MARTVSVATLGCRVNQYESQAIIELLEGEGVSIVPQDEPADVYIVNTCTVTAESDRKARQLIRHFRKQCPSAKIIVTGCMAQRAPDEAVKAGADYVCGNRNKLDAARAALRLLDGIAPDNTATVYHPDALPFEKMSITRFGRTRAYLKIEDGCDGRCSYCIIPKVRGNVVSKPREDVIAEAKAIIAGGCREIVLTGIETSAYGDGLVELLKEINELDGLERIRMGSLDPSFMRAKNVDEIAKLTKVMPHFHLSMQSGSDRILRLMRRRYSRDMALENFMHIREAIPNVRFTTDMMTGFPGETDEDHADTLSFAEAVKFLHIHIFTYSRRPGTEAAEMKDLPQNIKDKRAAELASLQKGIKSALLDETAARDSRVLFETWSQTTGLLTGHSENFTEFSVHSDIDLRGEVRTVSGISHDGNIVTGRII